MDDILKALLEQEAELRFPSFDETRAMKLGLLIAERAIADGLPIAIDISRGERQLFHLSLPGASADNDQWIQRKRRSVNRFGHSSFYIGNLLKSQGKTLTEKYFISDQEYSAHGGAFPIFVEGTGLVGVVAVSGLPQEEDHRLLVDCLGKMLGKTATKV